MKRAAETVAAELAGIIARMLQRTLTISVEMPHGGVFHGQFDGRNVSLGATLLSILRTSQSLKRTARAAGDFETSLDTHRGGLEEGR